MKAQDPKDSTKRWYFFVDKCMPFGASISCSHFQRFSDAVAYLVKFFTGKDNVNYLDDFFFVALLKAICNGQVETFLRICKLINFPVSMEKTFWASTRIIFLGLMIDTVNQIICIPQEKIQKAKDLLHHILNNKSKKTTVAEMQQLTGFLNFLCKAVLPGRPFTRRLYAIYEDTQKKNMKKHLHVNVSQDMRLDMEMWASVFGSS